MAKKEIYCCLECGRDTKRECQICIHCMPIQHKSIFNRNEEQIGRSAMPTNRLFNIDNADDAKPLRRHDLR